MKVDEVAWVSNVLKEPVSFVDVPPSATQSAQGIQMKRPSSPH